MKILELCAVDFTLYHFLMPLIRGIASRDHEVVAACAEGARAAEVRTQGVRVEAIPFSRRILAFRQHLQSYRALSELLRREKFDIVHVHTPLAAAIGRLSAWSAGVPKVVYTAHGFYFHEHMRFWKRWFFVGMEWLLGRITDVLFTQAEEDASIARRYRLCRGGVIEAIHNGADPARFYPSCDPLEQEQMRVHNSTGADACVIVVVGRLVEEKGYRELLTAISEIDAILWVVGERLVSDHAKGIVADIERARNQAKLKQKVRFLGERTDVPEILRAADIFVLPSHREGMPRSIIEAMMTGLPVVATNIRGSREEVLHDHTGLLVPVRAPAALAEALERLVCDPALRTSMGVAGRAHALKVFDESRVVARQIELLGL